MKTTLTSLRLVLLLLFIIIGINYDAFAHDNVVVIPLNSHVIPAPLAKTGQILSQLQNDDGDYQKGVAAPNSRFIDNNNGTVTDNLTDLIWMKSADCTSFFSGDSLGVSYRNWTNALIAASNLSSGYCGLSDNSNAGDWRLPNIREIRSLVDYGQTNPALPTDIPIRGMPSTNRHFWSSTSIADNLSLAGETNFDDGDITRSNKLNFDYVLMVRD